MEIEPTEVASQKRTMESTDEWIKKSKLLQEARDEGKTVPTGKELQESTYVSSMLLHYNTDIVIGGYTGMFISVTEREQGKMRLAVNSSGSGVDADVFVLVKADNPAFTGIVENGDRICIKQKYYCKYLSHSDPKGMVTLVARVSGETEKWRIYNDFIPEIGPRIESGGYTTIQTEEGNCLSYITDHGKEGVLQVVVGKNSTQLYDQQIWRVLKDHCSFLEITSTSLYEEEVRKGMVMEDVSITQLPIQIQSSIITEQIRLILLLSPGSLLVFHHYDVPLQQNKPLLIDMNTDYSEAEDYLKDGVIVNNRFVFDSNLQNLVKMMLHTVSQVISLSRMEFVFLHCHVRIKHYIINNNDFEQGRIITSIIQLITTNMAVFDQVISDLSPTLSLSNLHLVLLYWNNQLEVMDNLCRLCCIIRGGQLLNQLILLEENESNEQKKEFYRDVLNVCSREYFDMMQAYLYLGVVKDYHNEFMIIQKKEYMGELGSYSEFELNPLNELSAISSSSGKILLCGHYINIVNQTGVIYKNPCYKEWTFDYDVTVYGENIDEAFDYANLLLLSVLRNENDITHYIHSLNQLFFLLKGELCIYLYDTLQEYLTQPAQTIDMVKVQSLFQQCLIQSFRDTHASTQRFIEGISVSKRRDSDKLTGWEAMEIGVSLEYPLNIIINNVLLQKYKSLFSLLLLLNRCCRSLDCCWALLNDFKEHSLQKRLLPDRMRLNNYKYFINTILYYLSTDVIIPATTAFEKELPNYTSIDDLIKSFEDYVGNVYQECFLISDLLVHSLRSICSCLLEFVQYVNDKLNLEKEMRRSKEMDMSDESVIEEKNARVMQSIKKEMVERRTKRVNDICRITESTEWREKMKSISERFEKKRDEFLMTLENQPGFLQSSFLSLHRKLKQKYQNC